jgi:hypothetical protein
MLPRQVPRQFYLVTRRYAQLGPAAAVRSELRKRVRAVELERAAERTRTVRRLLGRRAVLAQSRRDLPVTVELRGNLRPRIATRGQWTRIDALLRNRAFAADYASARDQWRNGLPAVFPAGTYWLRRSASVPMLEPPEPSRVAELAHDIPTHDERDRLAHAEHATDRRMLDRAIVSARGRAATPLPPFWVFSLQRDAHKRRPHPDVAVRLLCRCRRHLGGCSEYYPVRVHPASDPGHRQSVKNVVFSIPCARVDAALVERRGPHRAARLGRRLGGGRRLQPVRRRFATILDGGERHPSARKAIVS